MSDSGCNLTWCCKKCFPNNGAQFERHNEVRKSNKYSIIYLTASFFGLKSSVQWKGTQTREEVNIEISKSIIRVTAIYKNVYINDIEASGWGQIKNRWTHFPLCAHTHTHGASNCRGSCEEGPGKQLKPARTLKWAKCVIKIQPDPGPKYLLIYKSQKNTPNWSRIVIKQSEAWQQKKNVTISSYKFIFKAKKIL